ncbi:hypothetical protein F4861DRAFT_328758 [Xylaria intraflava]|nr:hypothetical protein F4861DRAFT_328758 [Xylaria intraflava]
MSQPRGQPERSKSYGSWVFWRRFRDVRDTTNAASKTIEVQPRSQPSPSREPPLGTSTVMSEVVSDQPNKPRRSNDGDTGPGDGEEYHGNHESGPPEAHAELGELELEPLRDLWAEAWESDDVGDERRTLLRGKWGDGEVEELGKGPKDLINNVIALTEYKLGTYARRWGVEDNKATSGKARSILLSALTVKEIIETGFKFDPTGCGSAAWAVVSFGLKVRKVVS